MNAEEKLKAKQMSEEIKSYKQKLLEATTLCNQTQLYLDYANNKNQACEIALERGTARMERLEAERDELKCCGTCRNWAYSMHGMRCTKGVEIRKRTDSCNGWQTIFLTRIDKDGK